MRDHVLRVEAVTLELAARHGLEPHRLRLAALGHDLVRHETPARLLELAREQAIAPDEVERTTPVLLHGPIAARILEREYAVTDADVLAAVAFHTTARPAMSVIEKALFLADKIEPDKLARNPEWRQVADLAATELDAAMLRFLDLHVAQAISKGWQVHPHTIEARNQLIRHLNPPIT